MFARVWGFCVLLDLMRGFLSARAFVAGSPPAYDVQDAAARAYELELEVRCGMCLEVKDDLRLLPCLHSFCGECLSGAVASTASGAEREKILCALCKVRSSS